MITDSEALNLYENLRRLLTEIKFEWVVAEVDSEVRLGKTETTRIRTFDTDVPSELLELTDVRYGKPTRFTRTIEYTPRERLTLLIDAVERASVDVAELHEAAISTLAESASITRPQRSISEISFVDPISGETRESSTAEARRKLSLAAANLRPLLQEIRQEL
jgi:hypothetical protein